MSDTTRSVKEDFADQVALVAALANIFNGEEEDFAWRKFKDGFSCHRPVEAVSPTPPPR